MKLTKVISEMMVAATLTSTMVVVTPNLTAQAKAKMSLKTIPKQFRGTWYHYEKADGYDYQKITTTKIKNHYEHKTTTNTIHQFNLKQGITKMTKKNWMFAYKESANKYVMANWNTYTYFPKNELGTYQMTTRKYKGKTIKVIKRTLPNSSGAWYIYSPNKAMAKHLWNLDNKK